MSNPHRQQAAVPEQEGCISASASVKRRPKTREYTQNQRKAVRAKIDSKLRSRASDKFIKAPSITKWNEIARYIAAGRDTGRIAIYLNMPEWIVKILVQHIAMTNAGQGTAAQNLEEANMVIKATNMRVQR